jgi:polynucleotide 5'-hydroxyl-kinase GRC3/NOL9
MPPAPSPLPPLPTPDNPPDEWRPGLDALRALPDGGAAMLVAATDRGKTTFATLAARVLAEEFGRVAVIDADTGQSEIGPPGTVGAAWATPDAERLHDLRPAAQFFVGAFAPPSVALELVVATAQAVRWARAGGARRILIDTTGFVAGAAARRLKAAKAQAVAPDLLLGLSRGDEIAPLLAAMAAASGARAMPLQTPAAVGRKATALRTTRRLTRLSKALEAARRVALPLSDVATVGALLGAGDALTPELARWTGTALRLPVAHVERTEGTLNVFVHGSAPRAGWEDNAGPVAQHFGCRTVRTVALSAYVGAYIGLSDAQGRLLAVGRWEGLDAERGEALVFAPPPATAERVRLVQFGRIRIGADGAYLSEVRPGEI